MPLVISPPDKNHFRIRVQFGLSRLLPAETWLRTGAKVVARASDKVIKINF
jgi:hypothetical protein